LASVAGVDKGVGHVLDYLKKAGLDENTIVIYTSDNGATYLGPMAQFFHSDGKLRGLRDIPYYGGKGSMYEGGVREPLLVRWPGKVPANSLCTRRSGFEDWLPTLLDIAGAEDTVPPVVDGTSFLPSILGEKQPERKWMYREYPEYGGSQALWMGKWKGVRTRMQSGNTTMQLYDLSTDEEEKHDVAKEHPEIIGEMLKIMKQEHKLNKMFPIQALDADKITNNPYVRTPHHKNKTVKKAKKPQKQ